MLNFYLPQQTYILSYILNKIVSIFHVYEDAFNHKQLFDFSNYLDELKFYDTTNKRIIGKMKDESEEK